MNKYENAKIYAIRSPHTEKYYIGSTISSLSKRFHQHKCQKNTSQKIIMLGDAYIELLENFPCKSKDELRKREGEYLRKHKSEIVNYKIQEARTPQEKEIYHLNYKITSISEVIERSKNVECYADHIKILKNHLEELKQKVNELQLYVSAPVT